jgi:putative transposase
LDVIFGAMGRPCALTVIGMKLRYNVRVYPSASQQACLARAFGCARVVWNDALRLRRVAYGQGVPRPTAAELSKRATTEAKKAPERAWLGEASAVVLQQSLRDLETAYSNFFASKKRHPQGSEDGPAEGEEEDSPTGDQVYRQCLPGHHQEREASAAEDRRRRGALVA